VRAFTRRVTRDDPCQIGVLVALITGRSDLEDRDLFSAVSLAGRFAMPRLPSSSAIATPATPA